MAEDDRPYPTDRARSQEAAQSVMDRQGGKLWLDEADDPIELTGKYQDSVGAIMSEVIAQLAQGVTMVETSRRVDMPTLRTLVRWRHRYPRFADAIEEVRTLSASIRADEAYECVMGAKTKDEAAVANVQARTLMQLAERMDASRWSTRGANQGGVSITINTDLQPQSNQERPPTPQSFTVDVPALEHESVEEDDDDSFDALFAED